MEENIKALFTPVDAGHTYELANHESDSTQMLYFIKKEPVEDWSTELKTVHEGTTNEAVLEVLIDRLMFLDEKMPNEQNAKAIHKLQGALEMLNRRTAERKARGVEGTQEV